MTVPKKDTPKFTGGDNLTGLYSTYHEAMMQNELWNGYGAYQLSYASGNSGLSFGGNQMDMSQDPYVIDIFLKILTNAINNNGDRIFNSKEISILQGGANYENLVITGKTPEYVFGQNLPKINTALSSEYGIQLINEVYVEELTNKADHIEAALLHMKNPAAKAFYDSDLGRALLCDYHNQFNLALDGVFLQNYIDGQFNGKSKTVYGTDEKMTAPTDVYTLEDHINFIHSTKQWFEHSQNSDNRIEHVVQIVSAHTALEINNPLEEESILEHSPINWDENLLFCDFDDMTNKDLFYAELCYVEDPQCVDQIMQLEYGKTQVFLHDEVFFQFCISELLKRGSYFYVCDYFNELFENWLYTEGLKDNIDSSWRMQFSANLIASLEETVQVV